MRVVVCPLLLPIAGCRTTVTTEGPPWHSDVAPILVQKWCTSP